MRILASSSQVVVVKLSVKQSNFNFRFFLLDGFEINLSKDKRDTAMEASLDII